MSATKPPTDPDLFNCKYCKENIANCTCPQPEDQGTDKTSRELTPEKAEEWYRANYHTPTASIPVLLGIHTIEENYNEEVEEWKDVPINELLIKFAEYVLDQNDVRGLKLTIEGLGN